MQNYQTARSRWSTCSMRDDDDTRMKMEAVCLLCNYVELQGGPYRKRQRQIPWLEAQCSCTEISSTERR